MVRSSVALSLFVLALPAADPARFEYEEPHMGTKFRIVLYAADKPTADAAAKATFARVAELNRIMSDYDPNSELSTLCESSLIKPGGPKKVSDDLFFVLAKGREVSELSDGAFDVTIGPVVRLWRQVRKDRRLPDPEVLKAALDRVGYKKMILDPKTQTVDLQVAGMQLDLGGIAKGYAADEGLKVLARHGITSALVAASGDIAVSAPPPGKAGWRVDIAPLPGSKDPRQLLLKDAAVSTSGIRNSSLRSRAPGTRTSSIPDRAWPDRASERNGHRPSRDRGGQFDEDGRVAAGRQGGCRVREDRRARPPDRGQTATGVEVTHRSDSRATWRRD